MIPYSFFNMPERKVFKDRIGSVRLEQDVGKATFFALKSRDIYPILHYLKSHPEILRNDRFYVKKGDIIELDGEEMQVEPLKIEPSEGEILEIYKPTPRLEYNFILLNQDMQHKMTYVVREFATFLYLKRNHIHDNEPRETLIRQFNPNTFDYKDAHSRSCPTPYNNIKGAYSQVSTKIAPGKHYAAVFFFANKDSSAANDCYLDFLQKGDVEELDPSKKKVQKADLEKLLIF